MFWLFWQLVGVAVGFGALYLAFLGARRLWWALDDFWLYHRQKIALAIVIAILASPIPAAALYGYFTMPPAFRPF